MTNFGPYAPNPVDYCFYCERDLGQDPEHSEETCPNCEDDE